MNSVRVLPPGHIDEASIFKFEGDERDGDLNAKVGGIRKRAG